MNKQQLLSHLAQLVEQYGSQKATAKKIGISQQYLCDVLHNRRDPSEKLLRGLHLREVVTYEKR